MAQTGVKLTFPNGDVFEATEDVSVSYQTEENPLAGGGGQLAALFERFISGGGTSGRYDSQKQTASISLGAGMHRMQVNYRQATGSTGATWGGAPSAASAKTKVEYLDDAINSQVIDSNSPLLFESGEFSTSGDFDPIDVGVEQSQIEPDSTDGSPSTFSGTLTLVDIVSLQQVIDASRRNTDR